MRSSTFIYPLVAFAVSGVFAKELHGIPSALYREDRLEPVESNATFSLFERAGTDVIDPRFLNGCAKVCGGQQCCGSHQTSSTAKVRALLSKRDFEADISKYSQKELGEYMLRRAVTDANVEGSPIEFVVDSHDDIPYDQSYWMKIMNPGDGEANWAMPMPTSRFMALGDEPYTVVMRTLSGCTLLTMIKPFDPSGASDQPIGVWMGHMWEMPSFVPETDENNKNNGGSGSAEPILQIARTFDTWVLEFLDKGFPFPGLPQPGTKPSWRPDPIPQDGITEHLDVLKGGYSYLMHPMQERVPDDSEVIEYINSPQYSNDLSSIKSKITAIDPTAKIDKEFLYKGIARDYDFVVASSPTGKAVFEYVPNRNNRRYGRLLMEDGGEQITVNGEKVIPGLKEFDFGPAST